MIEGSTISPGIAQHFTRGDYSPHNALGAVVVPRVCAPREKIPETKKFGCSFFMGIKGTIFARYILEEKYFSKMVRSLSPVSKFPKNMDLFMVQSLKKMVRTIAININD